MKLSTIILVIGAGIGATAVGWIYQSQTKPDNTRAELEIPIDIDYYLSQVKYRVMAKTGQLDYELRSPYLQHFKQTDISRVDTPEIDIYRNNQHWQIEAKIAEIEHRINYLHLINDVRINSKTSKIEADRAEFDLDSNTYLFTNIKSVYY